MRANLIVSMLFLAVTPLVSCTPGPLEGDWFLCADQACTGLEDEGVRFTADGRWAALEAPGAAFEPGEPYGIDGVWGTYSLDGSTLTLRLAGTNETQSVQVSFDGDDLLIHGLKGATACIQPAPVNGGDAPPPVCTEEPGEEIAVRLRRVGDAGEVPSGDPVVEDDQVKSGSSTTPPPPGE